MGKKSDGPKAKKSDILEGFGPWLKSKIDEIYDGNVSAFVRKCEELDKEAAPDNSTVSSKYFEKSSTPGLDKAMTMAYALGLTLDQFARMEKPDQDDLDRAVSDFNKIAGGLVNHKKRPVVESKKFRGWTMFVAGRDQLTFDIVVTGRTDRARLIEIRENPPE